MSMRNFRHRVRDVKYLGEETGHCERSVTSWISPDDAPAMRSLSLLARSYEERYLPHSTNSATLWRAPESGRRSAEISAHLINRPDADETGRDRTGRDRTRWRFGPRQRRSGTRQPARVLSRDGQATYGRTGGVGADEGQARGGKEGEVRFGEMETQHVNGDTELRG